MHIKSLRDLFVYELKDLYDAEHQITKALPKMKEAASSKDLKDAFQHHLQQTEDHINRLEQVFDICGEKAERETCDAMKGLIKEGEELLKSDSAPMVLDAGLIGAAQRVEHYEMAGYGTARNYARVLGHSDAAEILQRTLDEEGETDKKLTQIASQVNPQATR